MTIFNMIYIKYVDNLCTAIAASMINVQVGKNVYDSEGNVCEIITDRDNQMIEDGIKYVRNYNNGYILFPSDFSNWSIFEALCDKYYDMLRNVRMDANITEAVLRRKPYPVDDYSTIVSDTVDNLIGCVYLSTDFSISIHNMASNGFIWTVSPVRGTKYGGGDIYVDIHDLYDLKHMSEVNFDDLPGYYKYKDRVPKGKALKLRYDHDCYYPLLCNFYGTNYVSHLINLNFTSSISSLPSNVQDTLPCNATCSKCDHIIYRFGYLFERFSSTGSTRRTCCIYCTHNYGNRPDNLESLFEAEFKNTKPKNMSQLLYDICMSDNNTVLYSMCRGMTEVIKTQDYVLINNTDVIYNTIVGAGHGPFANKNIILFEFICD
jgi:hypothetical protein